MTDLTNLERAKSKCLGFGNPCEETQGKNEEEKKKKEQKLQHESDLMIFRNVQFSCKFNRRKCQIVKKMTTFFNGPPTKPNQGKTKIFLHTQKMQ